jgi:Asp-tRNA(Asn)/Glu-tRNA(Gln) amidotransferase A subunit family amidase
VPLAVGTQTGGSVIRPASYCGVVGYKPSFGWLPTPGLKCFSWSLDTVGLFTRTVRDMAWAAQALTGRAFGAGAHGADSSASDAPRGRDGATLVIGVPLAYPWGEPSGSARHAVEVAAELLVATGVDVRAVALPPIAGPAFDAHAEVQNFEAATALHAEFTEHRNDLSTVLRRELEAAVRLTPAAYELAQHTAVAARRAFEDWRQAQGLDLLLTPSAPDEAPTGLESTGTSTFNRLWTLLGWPCVNVPGQVGTHGAPMGVQLIGALEDDARVLQVAAWLECALADRAATERRSTAVGG